MRKNLHHILIIFSMIDEAGHNEFLESFINQKYSFYDYKFKDFDPKTGLYLEVVSKKLTGKNQQNNIERYKRIAFEELQKYKDIANRKVNIWKDKDVQLQIEKTIEFLDSGNKIEAKKHLDNSLILLAEIANTNW